LGRHHPGRRRREDPNPRYLFRSTDNECEAIMSSLLTIKHWKGKFVTVAGINPDYSYGRNNMAAFVALLKRFNIEHKVVTEQWPKVGTMDLTSHVAALKAAKPDLIFSSLLFADLPVFMKQAHAAELTKGTKLVFPAAGWQHTLMKKEFTPEGMLFGHNTFYFDNPNASPWRRSSWPGMNDLSRTIPSGRRIAPISPSPPTRPRSRGSAAKKGSWPSRMTSSTPWSAYRSRVSAARALAQGSHRRTDLRAGPHDAQQQVRLRHARHVRDHVRRRSAEAAGANFWDWIKTRNSRSDLEPAVRSAIEGKFREPRCRHRWSLSRTFSSAASSTPPSCSW
jgi:branched-chain amino acid transport system substrate-binding protein